MEQSKKRVTPALLVGIFCGIIGAILLFLLLVFHLQKQKAAPVSLRPSPRPPLVILDAGHGGFDGGAIGPDGQPESHLNLIYCQTLAPMLRAFGFDVLLTRTDEDSLEEDSTRPIRERKRSDMHTRLAIMEAHPEAIFVSIHQNKSPYRSANGSVVYYSPNHPGSKELAQALQRNLVAHLQPTNRRREVEAGSGLFLLHKASCPAVLVECGFLSNPTEYEHLCDADYRKTLCLILAQTLSSLCSDRGRTDPKDVCLSGFLPGTGLAPSY